MDIQTTARLSALELLTTELLSARLLTVPDPELEVTWAIDHLCQAVDATAPGKGSTEDMTRLSAAVKEDLSRILKAALAQAKQVDQQRWDEGIARETKD
jgi:hypothetical protein